MADSPVETESAQVIFSAIRNKMNGNIPLYYRCYIKNTGAAKPNTACSNGKTSIKKAWKKEIAVESMGVCPECKKNNRKGFLRIDREFKGSKNTSEYLKLINKVPSSSIDLGSTSKSLVINFLSKDDGSWLMSSINLANIIADKFSNSKTMKVYRDPSNTSGIMGSIETLYKNTKKQVGEYNKAKPKNKQKDFNDINKWSPADIYYASPDVVTILSNEVKKQTKEKTGFTGGWGDLNSFLNKLIPKKLIPMSLKKAPIGNRAVVKGINTGNKKDKSTAADVIKEKNIKYHGYEWVIERSIWSNKLFYINATPSAQKLQFRDKAGFSASSRSFQMVITGGAYALDGGMASSNFETIISELAGQSWGSQLKETNVKKVMADSLILSKGINDKLVNDWINYTQIKKFKTLKTTGTKKGRMYDKSISKDVSNFFQKENLTEYLKYCKGNATAKDVLKMNKAYGNYSGSAEKFWVEMLLYSIENKMGFHWFGKDGDREILEATIGRQQYFYVKTIGGIFVSNLEKNKGAKSNKVVQEMTIFGGSKSAESGRHWKAADSSQL
jgi:hypothetical protein